MQSIRTAGLNVVSSCVREVASKVLVTSSSSEHDYGTEVPGFCLQQNCLQLIIKGEVRSSLYVAKESRQYSL